MSNTDKSIINGVLGLSPGSAVVGFNLDSVINGGIHSNDTLVNNAKLSLTAAYIDAAGRTLDMILVSDGNNRS